MFCISCIHPLWPYEEYPSQSCLFLTEQNNILLHPRHQALCFWPENGIKTDEGGSWMSNCNITITINDIIIKKENSLCILYICAKYNQYIQCVVYKYFEKLWTCPGGCRCHWLSQVHIQSTPIRTERFFGEASNRSASAN